MARAVLFDMDGVLAFTEQFYNERRADYLRKHGFSFDEAPDFSGSNDAAIWEALVPGDPRRRAALHAGYATYSLEHPTPWVEVANPLVRCTLWRLRRHGIRTAICSSSDAPLIREFLEALDLTDDVDLTISGHDCSAFKPSPEIYQRAMRYLGVTPEESIVVEDSPIGIEAGRRSGALVCALRPPEGVRLDQSDADVVIEELIDVVGLAKRLPAVRC